MKIKERQIGKVCYVVKYIELSSFFYVSDAPLALSGE